MAEFTTSALPDASAQQRLAYDPSGKHRLNERLLTLKIVKVLTETRTIECAMLNISVGGACILLPKNNVLPDNFYLAIDNANNFLACRLIWTEGAVNGVQFVQPLPFLPEGWAI